MTITSLNNNHDKVYAEGLESLMKAEAFIDFALLNDISEIPFQITHDYLWGVSDFIKKAKDAYEALEYLINR